MKGKFNLIDIARKGKAKLVGESKFIKGFSIDSRTTIPGDLYIALKGNNFDGHDFVNQAKENGAIAVVSEKEIDIELPILKVDKTDDFLLALAKSNRESFKGKVIGITGSNGKTSTKEILATLLSLNNKCHKTEGNKNNQIGLPLSMLSLDNAFNYSVLEMGTSFQGEISILNDLARPDIALITNANESHLSGLGNVELVAKEKGQIAQFHNSDGILILCRDSPYFDYWVKNTNAHKVISFGISPDSDFCVQETTIDLKGNKTSFKLSTNSKTLSCELRGLGEHNALNAAAAIAVCSCLDLDPEEIILALNEVALPERRLTLNLLENNFFLIDDTYNANPDSIKKSINLMHQIKDLKKILVLGEMAELGEESMSFHTTVAEYAQFKVDSLICIGHLWQQGIKNFGKEGYFFNTRAEAINHLTSLSKDDTVVLIKGSRSTKMDEVADMLRN